MKTTNLKNQAVTLLSKDKGSWRSTSDETGLSYDWMAKLSQGKINDPGASKLEVLIAYLSKKYTSKKSRIKSP